LKKLEDILKSVELRNELSDSNALVNGVAIDSRKVKDGYLFIAYKGVDLDGHLFIKQAILNGAKYIVLEDEKFISSESEVQYILVDEARKVVGQIAGNFYDHPSHDLIVVGVTGTNGKTTTASLLYALFSSLGFKSGLISTIENKYGDVIVPAKLTTPDAISLQALFAEMKDQNVSHVFMEVSSHALHQGRVRGIDYDLAVFTNITHDHLDYHKTFAEYIKAKQTLFDDLSKDANILINIDDRNGEVIAQHSKATKYSYALKKPAKFKGKVISNAASGLQMIIDGKEIFLRLVGHFNAYNALAAYGAGVILGVEEHELLRALSTLKSAEGRMDIVQNEKVNYKAIIDYAHTPDALEKVLKTLKDIKKEGKQLITVVGCGGNRDKTKRPKMAQIASRFSDVLLLTSDNPRDEDPVQIINEMYEGLDDKNAKTVIKITDRKEAIKMACMLAKDDDLILIAGKGHEKYQEVKGEKFPFDDKKIISAFMH